jgi:hypothetical protein
VAIDVLGGATGIGPSAGQGQPAGGAGRWFPPFSHDVNALKWFTYGWYIIGSLMNDETMMKCLIEF